MEPSLTILTAAVQTLGPKCAHGARLTLAGEAQLLSSSALSRPPRTSPCTPSGLRSHSCLVGEEAMLPQLSCWRSSSCTRCLRILHLEESPVVSQVSRELLQAPPAPLRLPTEETGRQAAALDQVEMLLLHLHPHSPWLLLLIPLNPSFSLSGVLV